jgi:hypothetical protein
LLEGNDEDGWVEGDDAGQELGPAEMLGGVDEEGSVEGPEEGALLELGLLEGAEESCVQGDDVLPELGATETLSDAEVEPFLPCRSQGTQEGTPPTQQAACRIGFQLPEIGLMFLLLGLEGVQPSVQRLSRSNHVDEDTLVGCFDCWNL